MYFKKPLPPCSHVNSSPSLPRFLIIYRTFIALKATIIPICLSLSLSLGAYQRHPLTSFFDSLLYIHQRKLIIAFRCCITYQDATILLLSHGPPMPCSSRSQLRHVLLIIAAISYTVPGRLIGARSTRNSNKDTPKRPRHGGHTILPA